MHTFLTILCLAATLGIWRMIYLDIKVEKEIAKEILEYKEKYQRYTTQEFGYDEMQWFKRKEAWERKMEWEEVLDKAYEEWQEEDAPDLEPFNTFPEEGTLGKS